VTRKIGVLTTGRADYGICLPILKAIQSSPNLTLQLLVTGMHVSPEFGLYEQAVSQDGFDIHERIEVLVSSDTPEGTAKSMGLAALGFAQAFSKSRPDVLVVVGDRFEVHAVVSAAVPFRIPIAHVHGGEITEGAIDEIFRHSITKMSHIHFATTSVYAKRIAQMGEEPWRIFVTGAPGLDNLLTGKIPTQKAIEEQFRIDLNKPTLLATYHPVTRATQAVENKLDFLFSAIKALGVQVVFTYPNADAGGRELVLQVEAFQKKYNNARLVINASQDSYIGLMKYVTAMVGNSSSGIIEAPSFELPVVNIGNRQAGRLRAANVIDVNYTEAEIFQGLQKAISENFQKQLKGLVNPYGTGHAGPKIGKILQEIDLDSRLINKRFVDYPNIETSGISRD